MRVLLIILPIILCAHGCVPPTTFVNTNEPNEINNLNEELKKHNVTIKLRDGKELSTRSSRIRSDELIYFKKNNKKVIPLTKIEYIKVAPKLSKSTIVGIPLMGLGVSSLFIYLNSGTLDHWSGRVMLPSFFIGLGVFTFGNNAETDIYYFNEQN